MGNGNNQNGNHKYQRPPPQRERQPQRQRPERAPRRYGNGVAEITGHDLLWDGLPPPW